MPVTVAGTGGNGVDVVPPPGPADGLPLGGQISTPSFSDQPLGFVLTGSSWILKA